jgi:hypothetical protein
VERFIWFWPDGADLEMYPFDEPPLIILAFLESPIIWVLVLIHRRFFWRRWRA